MSKAKIIYNNVAFESAEKFEISADDKADFSNLESLKNQTPTALGYGNPCDYYSVLLDGSFEPITNDIYFFSEQITNKNGVFEDPVTITFEAEEKFISSGLKFVFDNTNNIFATKIGIDYYSDGEVIVSSVFNPKSSVFYAEKDVELYDKIVVKFYSMNYPFSRLKVKSIIQGNDVVFAGSQLLNVSINQQMDFLSSELPISTCQIDLRSKKQYVFQEGQRFEVFFGDSKKGTFYVKKASKKSIGSYSIQCVDQIGVLENSTFNGSVYNNELAVDVIRDISKASGVSIEFSKELLGKRISGHIPYGSCRNALMLVLFAVGFVAKTSNRDSVYLFQLKDDARGEISKKMVLEGGIVSEKELVTKIDLSYHEYNFDPNSVVVYESSKSGIGENIFISFSNPMIKIFVENGDILEFSSNHCVINARENCVVDGYKYDHRVFKKHLLNERVPNFVSKKTISINNATLVGKNNVDNVLETCYNILTKREEISCKIKESTKSTSFYGSSKYGETVYNSNNSLVDLGDLFIIPTKQGRFLCRIYNQKYNLNGNSIFKELKGVCYARV